eukprot:374535-Pelagomonas_calceolata.AAC.1
MPARGGYCKVPMSRNPLDHISSKRSKYKVLLWKLARANIRMLCDFKKELLCPIVRGLNCTRQLRAWTQIIFGVLAHCNYDAFMGRVWTVIHGVIQIIVHKSHTCSLNSLSNK